jgi:hypothetical protein
MALYRKEMNAVPRHWCSDMLACDTDNKSGDVTGNLSGIYPSALHLRL